MSTSLSSISPPPVPIAGYASQPSSRVGGGAASPDSTLGRPNEAGQASAQDQNSNRSRPQQPSAEERQQQQVVQQLGARDREVRQHEMAHKAAGAGITGAVSYSYQRGPDGRMYAVGGEVSIDTSAISSDPQATLEKAEAIIRAAMAPAEPSSQDYRVAASARAMAAEARAELASMEEAEAAEKADAKPGAAEESRAEAREEDESRRQRLAEIREGQTESVSRLQQQLVESGVFSRMYPPGSLFNYQV